MFQFGGGWYSGWTIYVLGDDKPSRKAFLEFMRDNLPRLEKTYNHEFLEPTFDDPDEFWKFWIEEGPEKVVPAKEYPENIPNIPGKLYKMEFGGKGLPIEDAELFFNAAKEFFKHAKVIGIDYSTQSSEGLDGLDFFNNWREENQDLEYASPAFYEAQEKAMEKAIKDWSNNHLWIAKSKASSPKPKAASPKVVRVPSPKPASPRPASPKTVRLPAASVAVSSSSSSSSLGGQCRCTTQKGTRCSRKAQDRSQYCFQHQSCAKIFK